MHSLGSVFCKIDACMHACMYTYTIKIFGQYILVAIITNNPNKQINATILQGRKWEK